MNNSEPSIHSRIDVHQTSIYSEAIQRMMLSSFGMNGHIYIEDDSHVTSRFCAIQAFGGDVELEYSTTQLNSTKLTHAITIPDGVIIYGNISEVDVSSGTLLAYYAI